MTKHKILIIDDDHLILKKMREILEENGYEVIDADNGEKGLILAMKMLPQLVVLDVEMPKMRGWEVCKLLKHNPRSQNIFVLMITSRNEVADILVAMQQGADDYLTKPFENEELLIRVKRLIDKGKEIGIIDK